jgi:hypothetical protein
MALDLVDLVVLAAAEGRRIEDHGVVTPAALDLAGKKFMGVVHDPADWPSG